MKRSIGSRIGTALVVSVFAVACNSSSSGSNSPDAGVEHTTGSGGSTSTKPPDAFNGDCSSARWASVSDACWSCFCDTCKDTLNACNDDCVKGIACGTEKHALVGVAADVSCEIRAFTALCASDPVIAAQTNQLLAFDSCLINSHDTATEHLRACEAACNTTYTGDVCQRFPAPDGG